MLSLEVAEHIPRQFETSFLDNLERPFFCSSTRLSPKLKMQRHTCSGMVLSWGNQAGAGEPDIAMTVACAMLLSSAPEVCFLLISELAGTGKVCIEF